MVGHGASFFSLPLWVEFPRLKRSDTIFWMEGQPQCCGSAHIFPESMGCRRVGQSGVLVGADLGAEVSNGVL